MRGRARMNAMRSGVVVIGALAFGYLTLHLGFKPFLERAHQQALDLDQPQTPDESSANSGTIQGGGGGGGGGGFRLSDR